MKISARIHNRQGQHQVVVRTDDTEHPVAIQPKATGPGSQTNGGELLFLALATCYCNDLYREAAKRGITVEQVEVEVDGTFGGVGEPATGVTYRARVAAHADAEAVQELMAHTDTVAEIQNTLRQGLPVSLREIEATSLR
jgi:organic hydroperoxide reductase OsmC/OhrA